MKLAVYKDNLSTGRGADRAVKNFAAGLAARGHAVALFEKNELPARLDESWDVFIATGSNEIVDLARAGYFSRAGRAPVALQLHLAPSGFFKWRHPFRNREIRRAFNLPDAVQLLCKSYEAEFSRLAPRPQVVTIGNYTEIAAPPEPKGAAPSTTILYPAAALTKVKNQKFLITAFAKLAARFPEWRVRLLGRDDTRYAAECKALVHRLGLGKRISFAGFVTDLPSEYSRAAFIAFPSALEGFPLAILEAAKFSLAAVAQHDLPGATDIIQNNHTGLVTGASAAAYADGLARLMENEPLRREMGERAHAHCDEAYSREAILDRWERLLSELSSTRRGSGR